MMNLDKIAIVICLFLARGYAFSPVSTSRCNHESLKTPSFQPFDDSITQPAVPSPAPSRKGLAFSSKMISTVTGMISGLSGFVAAGMAEDLEYAELPPPYVPALFGVVLLAGVGALTASLGDVMTEGT